MLDVNGLDLDQVTIRTVNQATRATFQDMHVEYASLVFVQSGVKRVEADGIQKLVQEGDMLVMPVGARVTMENKPHGDRRYREIVVSFLDALVDAVFDQERRSAVQHVPHAPYRPECLLPLLTATLYNCDLPRAIRRHRMLEPLVWLNEAGFSLQRRAERMCVPRIERALTLLQTTDCAIEDIASQVGFASKAALAAAFQDRFGLDPDEIRVTRRALLEPVA